MNVMFPDGRFVRIDGIKTEINSCAGAADACAAVFLLCRADGIIVPSVT